MTPRFLAEVTRRLESLFTELEKKLDTKVYLKGNEGLGVESCRVSQRKCWVGTE